MKILIVEDSPQDRQILRYLLEARFRKEAKFRDASTLSSALSYLQQGDIDCVILDLQLPDSVGKETFYKIIAKHPRVPIIVMTNTKDRDLAVEMIQKGAADYIIKNYTDEEELFRRILFAIEKHSRTISVPPAEAASVHRLEQAKANMLSAHESGEHKAVQQTTVETTNAMADLSRMMFTEIQKLSMASTEHTTRLDQTTKIAEKLQVELIEGHPNKLSLKSAVELLDSRVKAIEEKSHEERTTTYELKKVEAHIANTRMSNRTKVIVALISVAGVLIGASVSAYVTINYARPKMEQWP